MAKVTKVELIQEAKELGLIVSGSWAKTEIEAAITLAKDKLGMNEAIVEEAPVKKGPSITASDALNLILFNMECSNIQNMMFMKKGDNYLAYFEAIAVPNTYPAIRARLLSDLESLPTSKVKVGEKMVTMHAWGTQSPKMKAHSLTVSIRKTVERRSLTYVDGKAEDKTLFQKWDKKAKDAKGNIVGAEVTKKVTITSKATFKPYDEQAAKLFLASLMMPKG